MKALRGTNLKRFLREYKRSRGKKREIAAMLQSVEYPYNVGAAFRLADGVGMSKLILTGITPTPPNPTIVKVGRFKDRNVVWEYAEDAGNALIDLKNDGYQIVALELTAEAVPYDELTYEKKICLVVGHEDHGITKGILDICDSAAFIPMYGKGLSLNVSVALGIAAFHIRQLPD
jgi:tRNA (guanosine-2'-O-)-methyltransferase